MTSVYALIVISLISLYNSADRQIRAVKSLEALGAEVAYSYEYEASQWSLPHNYGDVRVCAGANPSRCADVIRPLGRVGLIPVQIVGLRRTPAVQFCRFTTALRQLPSVEEIVFEPTNNAGISDDDLVMLPRLPRLRVLYLAGSPITARAVGHIGAVAPQLEILDVAHTKVSDMAISDIRRMGKLKVLMVDHSELTDEGLSALRKAMGTCYIERDTLFH